MDYWIKMRIDLSRDAKVILMTDHLMRDDSEMARYVHCVTECNMGISRNVIRNAIVGALVSIWGLARNQGKRFGDDLKLQNVTAQALDDFADLPGIGDAMIGCGWVVESDNTLVFPRFFEIHNEDIKSTAKPGRQRQKEYRDRKRNENVTPKVTNVTGVTVDRDRDRDRDVTATPLPPGNGDGDDADQSHVDVASALAAAGVKSKKTRDRILAMDGITAAVVRRVHGKASRDSKRKNVASVPGLAATMLLERDWGVDKIANAEVAVELQKSGCWTKVNGIDCAGKKMTWNSDGLIADGAVVVQSSEIKKAVFE